MKIPVIFLPSPRRIICRLFLAGGLIPLLLIPGLPFPGGAVSAMELCEAQSKVLMRSVGITESQISALCARVESSRVSLTLAIHRTEDELGYCRVTLALINHTAEYLNSLVMTTVKSRFDLFRFRNISPGGTGYASANSRIPLSCDELGEVKLTFHWPASIRIGNRSPRGSNLRHYKPALLDNILAWSIP